MIKLEIAAFSLEGALLANKHKVHRIEFCENFLEGGITPSYGQLKLAREKINTQLFAMIRPRGGDFLYSNSEFESMLSDIEICKQLKYDGIVVGCLNKNGDIEINLLKQIVALAKPMEITFHRAFDRVNNPYKSLEKIIKIGCNRVLTSGLQSNAISGLALLKELIKLANNSISIMPGVGVVSKNIKYIIEETGASEIHSSAKKQFPSLMDFTNNNIIEKN
ncbi:MAG: copper homeostasis protein CutC, partial [Sediminibacterium sp.]|nr:copper homeostasis protein CutC [Sediminibacterium sp.]